MRQDRRRQTNPQTLMRKLCATKDCEAGALLLRETPLACVATRPGLCACLSPGTKCPACPRWTCTHCEEHPCEILAQLRELEERAPADYPVDWTLLRLAAECPPLPDMCTHHVDQASHMGATILSELGVDSRCLLKLRYNAQVVDGGLAIFRRASAVNHSCRPNAVVSGAIELRAHRPLRKGDEITMSYLSFRALVAPRAARRQALKDAFNFDCRCERCEQDEVDVSRDVDRLAEDLLNRKATVDDIDRVLQKTDVGGALPQARHDLLRVAGRL